MQNIRILTQKDLDKINEELGKKLSTTDGTLKDNYFNKNEIRTNYYDKHEVNNKLLEKVNKSDVDKLNLENIYSKQEIDNLLVNKLNVSDATNIDNRNFYTKYEIGLLNYTKSATDNLLNEKADKSVIEELNNKINSKASLEDIGNISTDNFYNKQSIDEKISDLNARITNILTPGEGSGSNLDTSMFFTKDEIHQNYYNRTTIDEKLSNKLSNDVLNEINNKLNLKLNISDAGSLNNDNYYDKATIDSKLSLINTSIENLITGGSAPGGAGSSSDIDTALQNYYNKIIIDNKLSLKADKSDIDSRLSTIINRISNLENGQPSEPGNVDLSNYYNKTIIDQKIQTLSDRVANIENGEMYQVDLSDYYNKSSINDLLTQLRNKIDQKLDISQASSIDNSNFYMKSETYNREELDNKFSNTLNQTHLEEINRKFDTKLDNTSVVNIENFYNKEAVDQLLSTKMDKTDTGSLTYTRQEIDALLAKKQESIKPGHKIRVEPDGSIHLVEPVYKAGDNIVIDSDNRIHARYVMPIPSEPSDPTEIDPSLPNPITNFTSSVNTDNNTITLNWNMPEDGGRTMSVMILKNVYRYPSTNTDGIIIYEGSGNTYTDNVQRGFINYYRAFTKSRFDVLNPDGSQITKSLIKSKHPKPPAPVLVKKTFEKIILEEERSDAFRINGGPWQTSNIFTGLYPETEYVIERKTSETELFEESEISDSIRVTTLERKNTLGVKIDTTNNHHTTAISYTEGAIDMIPGSDEWDEIFGIYPCMLTETGEERKLNPNDFTQYLDGSPADIVNGTEGDVMICFPLMGYKIKYIDNFLHVSLTFNENEDGYCYDAFKFKPKNEAYVFKDKMYIAAFTASVSNGKCRSLSNKPYMNTDNSYIPDKYQFPNNPRWGSIGWYQVILLQVLFLLKYKTFYPFNWYPNVIGVTGLSGLHAKRGMTSYSEGSNIPYNKIFGIERFCDSKVSYFVDNIRFEGGQLWTWCKGEKLDKTKLPIRPGNVPQGWVKTVHGTNDTGFLAKTVGGDASSTTYYCIYDYNVGSGWGFWGLGNYSLANQHNTPFQTWISETARVYTVLMMYI